MRIIQQSATLEYCPTRDEALSAIERAGRTCYKSECVGDPAKFVKSILNKNHESVIEHCSATFRFITDRGVTHEMVRHRIEAKSTGWIQSSRSIAFWGCVFWWVWYKDWRG
jgi:thymidylate synthase (FAD)